MSNPTTPHDFIVSMINAANVKQWAFNELVLGAPALVTGETWNTSILVSPANGQPYTGSVEVHYNRVALLDIVNSGSTDFDLDSGYVTIGDLVPALRSRFNARLDTSDLVDDNLPVPDEDGVIHVTLQATPTSLLWRGTLAITLTPVVVPIDEVITVVELDGLEYGTLQLN